MANSNLMQRQLMLFRDMLKFYRCGVNSCFRLYSQDKNQFQKTESKIKDINPIGQYKAPQYFQHDKWTYVNHDLEMQKMRLPQPSSKTSLKK